MIDFIRQLADEEGRTTVKAAVTLRGSGNNNAINSAIRQRSGRDARTLGGGGFNDQIRKAATTHNIFGDAGAQIRSGSGRVHTGSSRGPVLPSIDKTLADQISQALLDE